MIDKQKLIGASQAKGLRNSLISIYYDIGRALPFCAQRFPDGRVSEFYKSQYYEVHQIKPKGKGGQYGDAYGYLYRNGVKVSNEMEQISCAACGSWVLIDILGEPTKISKMHYPDDVVDFGKYKGKTIRYIYENDRSYLSWIERSIPTFLMDISEIE